VDMKLVGISTFSLTHVRVFGMTIEHTSKQPRLPQGTSCEIFQEMLIFRLACTRENKLSRDALPVVESEP
jgi:hypothetical protein